MKSSIIQNKLFKGVFAFCFWFIIWYVTALLLDKEIFLPYPHTVIIRFFENLGNNEFYLTVMASFIRIFSGFIIGALVGFLLALFTNFYGVAEAIISPFIRVIRATPVVSFILLAYLWLDNDTIPAFIAILMVAPIIWQNVSSGLTNLDKDLLEMADVFKIKKTKKFFKIIFPQLKPYLFSGCMTSIGLAWKSGIAAEVISYPKIAIGKEMNEAKVLLETTDVFVWTFALIILSMLFEWVFKTIFQKKSHLRMGER